MTTTQPQDKQQQQREKKGKGRQYIIDLQQDKYINIYVTYHIQLALMRFDEILDLTADLCSTKPL